MSAGTKQLDRLASQIMNFSDRQLNGKLGEWKKHHHDTEKYQRSAAGMAAAQRRG